jgi:hypothetical protein
MYDAQTLKDAFKGLVGFEQPNDPTYPVLAPYVLQSTSGRIVNHVHPLCSIENIYNSIPEFDLYTYQDWTNRAYKQGEVVKLGGNLYRAKKNILAGYPAPDASADSEFDEDFDGVSFAVNYLWDATDPFSEYLNKKMEVAIIQMVSEFIRQKKLDGANRTLIDSQILFDGIGSFNDREIKSGRFVGFEISLSSQQGIQAIFSQVGLQADAAQSTLQFYLFHSSVEEALKTFTISIAKASSFNWIDVQDAMLKFYENTHDAAGFFYFGYFEDDLTGQAIRKAYDFINGPCLTCSEYNRNAFNRWSKYIKIRPFYAPASALDGTNIFDITKIQYDPQNNFGINIALSVYCDMTEFFILNKGLFADAYAMKIASLLLKEIAYSTRMTAISDKNRAIAMADIDMNAKSAWIQEYINELRALSVDFSGLSSKCLAMPSALGIEVGAI